MEPVVRLANDIAANVPCLPGQTPEQAVAEHLRAFWEPRLRRELADQVAAGNPDLSPLVLAAEALG